MRGTGSNFKIMPARDRGPSKYFEKVTDLIDFDEDFNRRQEEVSEDDEDGSKSKHAVVR